MIETRSRARSKLDLPPPYRPVVVPAEVDAFAHARDLVAKGATDDGTFVWSERSSRFDCALVLVPEEPLAEALLVLYPAWLGLGDALGAVLPPVVAVHFRWPAVLEVNGSAAGRLRLAWENVRRSGDVPAWIVLGLGVAMAETGKAVHAAPGAGEATSLGEEGGAEVAAADLAERFSRHFLAWLNRWQTDGFAPLREAWLARASGGETPLMLAADGRVLRGRPIGLDDEGGLLLAEDGGGKRRRVALAAALKAADA